MPEADAATYRFHPFDLTKVWLKGDYPLMDVGVMELDRNRERLAIPSRGGRSLETAPPRVAGRGSAPIDGG